MDKKQWIARRVARELKDGDVVNLGIGLPTLVADYVPDGIQVIFQAENGMLGTGPLAEPGAGDKDYFNAGGARVIPLPGAAFFDSATSFAIIRGGHVDVTVLGALQVDEEGNLANWMVPGKRISGMGGAMDLVVGARYVIVAMEHMAKGMHKICKRCTYPLTAAKAVHKIITEMAVFDVETSGLILREIAPGLCLDDVRAATEADFAVDENLKVMMEEE
jgi:acetate CoA/acetoacetate CoA-transferase beta subunit